MSNWDISISMEILANWMNAMYHCTAQKKSSSLSDMFSWSKKDDEKDNLHCVGGWIPREMILGKDAERRY